MSIERAARGDHPQVLVEHQNRFTNRIYDRLRKRARFFDLGQLIFGQVGLQAIPREAPAIPARAVYRWCASWDVLSVMYITDTEGSRLYYTYVLGR